MSAQSFTQLVGGDTALAKERFEMFGAYSLRIILFIYKIMHCDFNAKWIFPYFTLNAFSSDS